MGGASGNGSFGGLGGRGPDLVRRQVQAAVLPALPKEDVQERRCLPLLWETDAACLAFDHAILAGST